MTAKEKERVDQLITFMDCPCRIFEPMEDDDPIQEAYREAKERGRSEGSSGGGGNASGRYNV